MTERTDLTRYRLDLLYALAAEEPCSGDDIRKRLEAENYERITSGTHYTAVGELVDGELVEKQDIAGQTKEYRLTDDGRDLLAADLEMRERLLNLR